MLARTKGKGNEYLAITEYNGLQVARGPGEKGSMAGECMKNLKKATIGYCSKRLHKN
jgi:hypothetical protein